MENNDHTHLNHQNPKIFKTKNKNIKSYTILNLTIHIIGCNWWPKYDFNMAFKTAFKERNILEGIVPMLAIQDYFTKRLLAQPTPPSVFNEDVQGSNPPSPI